MAKKSTSSSLPSVHDVQPVRRKKASRSTARSGNVATTPRKKKRVSRPKPAADETVLADLNSDLLRRQKRLEYVFFVGLFVLVAATLAPSLSRMGWLPPIPAIILPAPTFDEVVKEAPGWLEFHPSDDYDVDKYIAAIDMTIAELPKASSASDVMTVFNGNGRHTFGRTGWLDWAEVNQQVVSAMRRAKAAGKLDDTAASHVPFFEALKKGISNG